MLQLDPVVYVYGKNCCSESPSKFVRECNLMVYFLPYAQLNLVASQFNAVKCKSEGH